MIFFVDTDMLAVFLVIGVAGNDSAAGDMRGWRNR